MFFFEKRTKKLYLLGSAQDDAGTRQVMRAKA
jgi:hypothetical protein